MFCTALGDEEVVWRRLAVGCGATSYVVKPFDTEQLVAEVVRAAGARDDTEIVA